MKLKYVLPTLAIASTTLPLVPIITSCSKSNTYSYFLIKESDRTQFIPTTIPLKESFNTTSDIVNKYCEEINKDPAIIAQDYFYYMYKSQLIMPGVINFEILMTVNKFENNTFSFNLKFNTQRKEASESLTIKVTNFQYVCASVDKPFKTWKLSPTTDLNWLKQNQDWKLTASGTISQEYSSQSSEDELKSMLDSSLYSNISFASYYLTEVTLN